MNVHGIINRYVGAVNPTKSFIVKINSGGYATSARGGRTPAYVTVPATFPTYPDNPPVFGQFQPLSYTDIMQIDKLNLQGTRAKVFLNQRINGLVRAENEGGDLVVELMLVSGGYVEGNVWRVAMTPELWPDWTSALLTLQNNS